MSEKLEPETCRECKKAIMVAKYSPHPLDYETTGMAASRFDEHCQEYFVGWICNECAWDRAMNEGGGGGIGFGGGSMDFCYDL